MYPSSLCCIIKYSKCDSSKREYFVSSLYFSPGKKSQLIIPIQRAKVGKDWVISSDSVYQRILHLRSFNLGHPPQELFCGASFLTYEGQNYTIPASVSPIMHTKANSHCPSPCI